MCFQVIQIKIDQIATKNAVVCYVYAVAVGRIDTII